MLTPGGRLKGRTSCRGWGSDTIELEAGLIRRCIMKWAGMYFVGFVLLIAGAAAALWKLGILQNIETIWIVIGVVILAGVGIMVSVANSGTKENIQIDRK
jgi:hypothetical protein